MTASSALAPFLGRYLAGELIVREHETDQRIIDAVLAELRVTQLQKLSLADVADRAGLTRMTVYRRFGDRQGVIEATFAREVSRFLDGILAADDPDASPSARIAEAFATALTLTYNHPLATHLLETSPGELLETMLADDGFVLAAGGAFITAQIEQPDAERPLANPRLTGEMLTRLFVALVLMPPPSVDLTQPDQARRLAYELVVPLVFRSR